MNTEALYSDAVALLRDLIRIPSPSREEAGTAERLAAFLSDSGIETHRKKNNVWAFNRHYDSAKPTILLNSHHDTRAAQQRLHARPLRSGHRGRPALRAWQQRRRSERRIAAGGLPALLRPGRDEIQPVRGDHGRGREQRQRRAGMRAARAGSARLRHRRRAHANAAGHRRTGIDGRRLHGARTFGPRGARGRRQRDLQGHAGHRVVPELPFPEGVGTVRGGQDDRHDHFGAERSTMSCRPSAGSRSTSE